MRNTWAGTRGLSTQTSSSTGQMRGEQQSSAGGLRHWGGTRRCGRDLGALPRILTWGVAGSVAEPPGGSRVAHDVFISYSHRDKAVADAVCAGLEAARIRCWVCLLYTSDAADEEDSVALGGRR